MRFVILSITLLGAGAARAGERKVDPEDLPKPVLAAVEARFPEAKVVEAAKEEEDGSTVYEVEVEDDGATVEVSVSAQGKILEVERAIAAKKLPRIVKAVLEAKYPEAEVEKAEEVIRFEDGEERKSYEVVLSAPGEGDLEVKLSRKGKILEDGDEQGRGDRKGRKTGKGTKKG